MALLVGIGLLFQWAGVLFEALLPQAASASLIPRVSGLAQALGNVMSILVLVLVLWAFVLPGQGAVPGVPTRPLLGLDQALHEPERFAGPLVAAVLLAGSLPLFLLTPDKPRQAAGTRAALGAAPAELWRNVQTIRGHRDGLAFLIARMLYTDGLVTILVFTGVYATGVLGWPTLDLLLFGLIASLAAAVGREHSAAASRPPLASCILHLRRLAAELTALSGQHKGRRPCRRDASPSPCARASAPAGVGQGERQERLRVSSKTPRP